MRNLSFYDHRLSFDVQRLSPQRDAKVQRLSFTQMTCSEAVFRYAESVFLRSQIVFQCAENVFLLSQIVFLRGFTPVCGA
jgi:hypothetical protein